MPSNHSQLIFSLPHVQDAIFGRSGFFSTCQKAKLRTVCQAWDLMLRPYIWETVVFTLAARSNPPMKAVLENRQWIRNLEIHDFVLMKALLAPIPLHSSQITTTATTTTTSKAKASIVNDADQHHQPCTALRRLTIKPERTDWGRYGGIGCALDLICANPGLEQLYLLPEYGGSALIFTIEIGQSLIKSNRRLKELELENLCFVVDKRISLASKDSGTSNGSSSDTLEEVLTSSPCLRTLKLAQNCHYQGPLLRCDDPRPVWKPNRLLKLELWPLYNGLDTHYRYLDGATFILESSPELEDLKISFGEYTKLEYLPHILQTTLHKISRIEYDVKSDFDPADTQLPVNEIGVDKEGNVILITSAGSDKSIAKVFEATRRGLERVVMKATRIAQQSLGVLAFSYRHQESLTHLWLTRCKNVRTSGIQLIMSHCPNLLSVKLMEYGFKMRVYNMMENNHSTLSAQSSAEWVCGGLKELKMNFMLKGPDDLVYIEEQATHVFSRLEKLVHLKWLEIEVALFPDERDYSKRLYISDHVNKLQACQELEYVHLYLDTLYVDGHLVKKDLVEFLSGDKSKRRQPPQVIVDCSYFVHDDGESDEE